MEMAINNSMSVILKSVQSKRNRKVEEKQNKHYTIMYKKKIYVRDLLG